MANPLRNEEHVYEQIKNENITVHPLVWELINHHVRNDLHLISLAVGSLRFTPLWILKCSSFFMKFLWRITFQKGDPIDLVYSCDTSLNKIKNIDTFLEKLKKATYKP